MPPSSYRVVALERGLAVLSAFDTNHRVLGTSEAAALVGLPVATTYRLLRTMTDSGYLEQLPDGRFTPALRVLNLGFSALQDSDVVEAARDPLASLAARTHETCNLGVLTDTDVLYLIRHRTSHFIVGNLYVGSTLPAAVTSMGKLLLALQPTERQQELLERLDLAGHLGPNAHRDLAELRSDLAQTAERGWGVQDQEVSHGLRSVSAPIHDVNGVVAAINIAVEAARCPRQRMLDELLPQVLDTAAQISLKLGYLAAVGTTTGPDPA
jgi:IclR family pca regulon transcriptional regulator